MSQQLEVLKKHLAKIDEVIENGQYKDNWDSLAFHKVPDWYRKGKFGIFIHWGPYSVPAFGNEWYARAVYKEGTPEREFHEKTFGKLSEFGYKDFIPKFQAEKFDAKEWADLFKEAGAKFVMPVAEHHDGFQMYDSELSEWCASKMGPCRDIVGELKEAVEERNMEITASSHRVEHYWFMGGMREFESDFTEEVNEYGHIYWPSYTEPFAEYGTVQTGAHERVSDFDVEPLFMEDWLARTCEIVDKYQPKIMYFDWWIQVEAMKPYLKKFAAYYYNRALEWGKEVTINFKYDAFMFQTGVRDLERGQLGDISPTFWQNDTAVAKNSWGYTEGNDYKEPHEIICNLVDAVSKNGALLLNVGPRPDGTIPEEDQHILREIGKWLAVNGEGIYDTYHWKRFGEGPTVVAEGHFTDVLGDIFTPEDFRYTYKPGFLYAFALKWPEDGVVRIQTLGRENRRFMGVIQDVEVLGAPDGCDFKLCDDYLTVMADGISTKAPVCIKIMID